ncbi:O-fucosyltransferase 39 [Bienertia sinuspersici]
MTAHSACDFGGVEQKNWLLQNIIKSYGKEEF